VTSLLGGNKRRIFLGSQEGSEVFFGQVNDCQQTVFGHEVGVTSLFLATLALLLVAPVAVSFESNLARGHVSIYRVASAEDSFVAAAKPGFAQQASKSLFPLGRMYSMPASKSV